MPVNEAQAIGCARPGLRILSHPKAGFAAASRGRWGRTVAWLVALAVSLAALLAVPCWAAAPNQPFLPLKFGGWTLEHPQELPTGELAGSLGQNFAVLVESGLTSAERGTYTHSSGEGAARMQVMLYRLRDASGAYGAYTFLRTPDLDSSDLTEKSAIGRDRILAVVGNLLLDISGPGAASLADLKAMVTLLGQQTSPGVYPNLWQYLPGAGFERTSDRYVLGPAGLAQSLPMAGGDWLGFAQGAEAESARYRRGGETLTLLLAQYPTPQIALERLKDLETRFGVRTLAPGPAPDQKTADAHNPEPAPAVYAQNRGLMLLFVSGARDARSARALFDHVEYETEVTWNEPSWTAKEKPFLVMIVDILVATCVLLLYAFLAGLAFAGIRLLVKMWKPGQIFDRDADVEVLQLGLGSKPIEAKDFLTLGTRK